MSVIVQQFQTVRFIQMMSLTFGLFTQVSGSGPLGPLVWKSCPFCYIKTVKGIFMKLVQIEKILSEYV